MNDQIYGIRAGWADPRPAKTFLIFATGITVGFLICGIYAFQSMPSLRNASAPTVRQVTSQTNANVESPQVAEIL